MVTAQTLALSISHSSALGFQEYTVRQLHLQGSVGRKRIVGFVRPHHISSLLRVFLGQPGVQWEPASGWGSVPVYPKSVPTPSQDGAPAVGQGPFLGSPLISG